MVITSPLRHIIYGKEKCWFVLHFENIFSPLLWSAAFEPSCLSSISNNFVLAKWKAKIYCKMALIGGGHELLQKQSD